VLDPYTLAILLIALIHIVCCLKIYVNKTLQMGFVFFLRLFQDKFNRDCNRDYFQSLRFCLFVIEHVASNRNWSHLCCNRPISAELMYLQLCFS